jgi:hypothetical protein
MSKSILGEIAESIGSYSHNKKFQTKMDREQRKLEASARTFLANTCKLYKLFRAHTWGKILRLIAGAHVTCIEGELLTRFGGEAFIPIHASALKRVATNILKLQDSDKFPLYELLRTAKSEEFMFNASRMSFQSYLRTTINMLDDDDKRCLNMLLSGYFNMDKDTAKLYEVEVSILAGYLEMYPPDKNEVTGDTTVSSSAISLASASVSSMNNNSVNVNGVTAEQMGVLLAHFERLSTSYAATAHTTGQDETATSPSAEHPEQTAPARAKEAAQGGNVDDAEKKAQAWEAYAKTLKRRERQAALAAAGKHRGMSAAEIYKIWRVLT